jgi:hypothetical protein
VAAVPPVSGPTGRRSAMGQNLPPHQTRVKDDQTVPGLPQ